MSELIVGNHVNPSKRKKELSSIVTKLDWDTNFFGFPVAQLTSNRIKEKDIVGIFEYCRKNKIRLLQFKCDAHHQPSIELAEEYGFHFADIRMTFARKLLKNSPQPAIKDDFTFRRGLHKDVEILREVVADIYQHSRYYFDPNFPKERVQIFYQDWIEKAVLGTFDDFAWVICVSDRPVGFCTIKLLDNQEASIGLVGIDKSYMGMSLGTVLMQQVLFNLKKEGISLVKVVTQGRNYAAQRLYQNNGFLIDLLEIYYHRWFDV